MPLLVGRYNRDAAVEYAHRWAFTRNPTYYNFDGIGGDCTNFISQCLYEGCGVMNYTKDLGWYYINANKRAPAWTSVIYLYNFLIRNKDLGPFGHEIEIDEVQKGDIAQLILDEQDFQHSPIIVAVGQNPHPGNVLIAAHSKDSDNRPLSTYSYKRMRFIHIDGFRFS